MTISKIIGLSFLFVFIGACENRVGTTSPTLIMISDKRPAFIESQPFELGGKCNMETLNGLPWENDAKSVADNKPLTITGWGVDDTRKLTPKSTYLRVQDKVGREFYVAAQPVSRTDVADYFGERYFTQSGYQITASIEDLPLGTYSAMIVMDIEGKSLLCANGRFFTVVH